MDCDYCGKRIENPKTDQHFCSEKKGTHCRQKWHHTYQLPGVVKRCGRIKGGKWSVTIHYLEDPGVSVDQHVARLETEPNSRPEPSRDTNEEYF
jgi:hypothetical protein